MKGKVRIIFDVDDAVYLSKADNSDCLALLADVIICGNENLKQHYSLLNSNCIIIPTIEDTHLYQPFWNDTFNRKVVGWIGSKATLDNLDLIVEPINEIIERHPEVEFHIISNDAGDYPSKIKNCMFVQWNKNTYIHDMSSFTIGIMPLKDTKYNRGKCGFKLIQYLNMRKPVLGSPVGVNEDIIKGNGLTANDANEWKASLEKLLFNKKFYDECILHIDNDLFKKYHFDSMYQKLRNIIDG